MGIRKEKIAFLEKTLSDFLHRAGREHLPWRGKGIGAYEVWVSEIMLQQTQVSRVIGYYERFLERFPAVESLARTSWEEFLPYYRGLGYYARGRNMLKAAQTVVSEYGGKFPRDPEVLQRLPGVGPYTAAAIASFAYGRNAVAWDTNLRRIVGRFFFGSKKADIPFSEFGKRFSIKAKTLNAAMMDFGSAICVARPKCVNCPLRTKCFYYREGGKREYGKKGREARSKKKVNIDWKDAQVFVILHENHRKYYSPYRRKFAPFTVPASHNTRAGIKDWFREKHGLELSVRSPHKKEPIDGKPTLFVNAQILAGKPAFPTFGREGLTGEWEYARITKSI